MVQRYPFSHLYECIGATKREFNAGIEAFPPKRRRLLKSAETDAKIKNEPKWLTDGQIFELLRMTVEITRGWTTHQLENLFSVLEGYCEKRDGDMFLAFKNCLSIHKESEKLKSIKLKNEK